MAVPANKRSTTGSGARPPRAQASPSAEPLPGSTSPITDDAFGIVRDSTPIDVAEDPIVEADAPSTQVESFAIPQSVQPPPIFSAEEIAIIVGLRKEREAKAARDESAYRNEVRNITVGNADGRKFVANQSFWYGSLDLSMGQIFELKGYPKDAQLERLNYIRPLRKDDDDYECNIDGAHFIGMMERVGHVNRLYPQRPRTVLEEEEFNAKARAKALEINPYHLPEDNKIAI